MTHCFHPLYGQTLELVAIRHNWGVDQVYYHDSAGRLRTLPITWTSLISKDPTVIFGAGRAPFRLADLLELARLIEMLGTNNPGAKPQPERPADGHGGVK